MKEDVLYEDSLLMSIDLFDNIKEVDGVEDIDESSELDSDSLGKIKIRTKQLWAN